MKSPFGSLTVVFSLMWLSGWEATKPITLTSILKESDIHMNLVLGFSTGHVGTTSLSEKSSYEPHGQDKQSITMIFEEAHVNKTEYSLRNWTISDEVWHFERIYGPYLFHKAQKQRNKAIKDNPNLEFSNVYTIADLSHSNLYFYRGLMKVAMRSAHLDVQFVRIRRDRIETVVSMSADMEFFEHELAVFQPFVHYDDVLLRVSQHVWDRFSLPQKVLWVIDETEARWRQLLKCFPGTVALLN